MRGVVEMVNGGVHDLGKKGENELGCWGVYL